MVWSLQVMWWAAVVTLMVRVVWVVQWVIASLVVSMAGVV